MDNTNEKEIKSAPDTESVHEKSFNTEPEDEKQGSAENKTENMPGKSYTKEDYDKARKSVRGQVVRILGITCAVAVVLAILTFMLIRSRLQ